MKKALIARFVIRAFAIVSKTVLLIITLSKTQQDFGHLPALGSSLRTEQDKNNGMRLSFHGHRHGSCKAVTRAGRGTRLQSGNAGQIKNKRIGICRSILHGGQAHIRF